MLPQASRVFSICLLVKTYNQHIDQPVTLEEDSPKPSLPVPSHRHLNYWQLKMVSLSILYVSNNQLTISTELPLLYQ
jgi:hypothetical protein